MIDPVQFQRLVRATLQGFTAIPYTLKAETLLLMTAAHESNLGEFLYQLKGPARGAWQMEPATVEDHYKWLERKPNIRQQAELFRPPAFGPADALVGNLPFACVMARVHYYRRPEALPEDLEGMSQLAKLVFNTRLGKATPDAYLSAYLKFYGGKK